MKHAASSTAYSRFAPPFPARSTGNFRLDAATGIVRSTDVEDDSSSSASDDDTHQSCDARSKRSASILGPHGAASDEPEYSSTPVGESAAHNLGLAFSRCPFMRPKVLVSSAIKCAPPPSANGAMVGFFDEGKLVYFGGNEHIKPTNETWIYTIPDKKWEFVDPMGVVPDALRDARRDVGFAGDRVPAPRCGHAMVGLKDVKDPTRIDPETLRSRPVIVDEFADRVAHQGTTPASFAVGSRATSAANTTAATDPNALSLLSSPLSLLSPTTANKGRGTTANDYASGVSASSWSYEPTALVFGGADLSLGLYFNDLWLFDLALKAWRELKPGGTPPCERWHHSACILEQRMFVYGGESADFNVLDDLHMYDHCLGAWRGIRTVQPLPPGRMLHAVAVCGDQMVVVGGVGSQRPNAALLDIAIHRGADQLHGAAGSAARRASYRRPSMDPGASGHRGSSGTPSEEKAPRATTYERASKLKDELCDVWVLNLRTLVWREVGQRNKRFSPFVVREDALLHGPTMATNGRSTAPPLAPSYGGVLQLKSLEGHSALAFNERILVLGGKLGGKMQRRVFSFHLPTETWAFLGELPTTSADSSLPLVRAAQASCVLVDRKSVGAMKHAVTCERLDAVHRHLCEDAEAAPLVTAMLKELSAQLSFSGLLSVYHTRPIVTRTVCAYMLGGAGSPKYHSDMWSLELTDHSADTTYEQLFGKPLDALLSGLLRPKPSPLAIGGVAADQQRLADVEEDMDEEEVQALESYVIGSSLSAAASAKKKPGPGGGASRNPVATAEPQQLQSGRVFSLGRRASRAASDATAPGVDVAETQGSSISGPSLSGALRRKK